MIRRLVALLVLVHAASSARLAAEAARPPSTDSSLACDATTDERARLAGLLAGGGALAGRTLELPAGCKVLLGSPGAGRAAVELASHTRISCASPSAGFVLARRSCRGGDLPGAACDLANGDRDCPGGGHCTDDVASGPFAPEPGSTYTVIGASPGSVGAAVSGCGIWVNGISGDSTASGGSGRRYGFCSAGASAGFSCSQQCSAESGMLAGFACGSDADCQRVTPGRCLSVEQCGAACGSPPPATAWGPSGPGFINPIDLGGSTGSRVDHVTIHDHRKGAFAIRVGAGGRRVEQMGTGRQANTSSSGLSSVTGCTTDATTATVTPAGILSGPIYEPRPFVDTGIVGAEFDCAIHENHVTASRVGIHAFSTTTVRDNLVGTPPSLRNGARPVDDSPTGAGLPRGIGILVSGNQTIVSGNHVSGYVGLLLEPDLGFNVTVADNRFFDGTGSKIIVASGSGAKIHGNYLAWGSSDNLECTGPGSPRECCEGNASGHCTGPGVVRIGFGEPGGRAGAVNHIDLVGNFLHSDQKHATYVRFDAVGRRCVKGDRSSAACASDAECPDVATCQDAGRPRACCSGSHAGSCVAACRPTSHSNVFIADNDFYSAAPLQTALDLSALAPDATTLSGMTVSGNRVTGFGRGVLLPRDEQSVTAASFTGNDFTGTAAARACTAAATPLPCCTGAGTGACPVFEGWRWTSGERRGDVGLTAWDEQPTAIVLAVAKGARFAAGDAVAIGPDGGVDAARSSADATGIALTPVARDGDSVQVAVSGVTTCNVAGEVAAGATLAVGSAPGRLATAREGAVVARALSPGNDDHPVRCVVTGQR